MNYVECVLPETSGCFHYHLPQVAQGKTLEPGIRLLVPFGRGRKVAYFIRSIAVPDVPRTKAVLALLDLTSLFSAKLFKLLCWISEYYQTPLGGVLKAALPQGIHAVPHRKWTLTDQGKSEYLSHKHLLKKEVLCLLNEKNALSDPELQKVFGRKGLNRVLSGLKKQGLIQDEWETSLPPVRVKTCQRVVLKLSVHNALEMAASLEKTAPRQAAAIKQLISEGGQIFLADFPAGVRGSIKNLIKKEIVTQREEVVLRKPHHTYFSPKGEIHLNPEQAAVLKEITQAATSGQFSPCLLHGVTGSGKTEVYLRAIEGVLAAGNSAILLLPEIGLTTHIAARFLERFGDQVALLHSGLSAGERYDEWRRIQEGKARLVIGARSAVFAPLQSLGIIIVDEEHDASYRQEEGSRYHARDVALVRGRDEKSVVLLGSATPSFESYFNAQSGKYRYLTLKNRVDARPLPQVSLVNLKEKHLWVRPFFTQPLYDALKIRIAQKEQTLLFVNRRGFSPFLLCHDCGFTPMCHQCTVSLTYHKGFKRLICHYCGYQTMPPTTCPDCGGTHLAYMGVGTEQIEETVRSLFPDARIARLDRDTSQKKGAYEQILSAMAQEEIDVLIGTQMIAKGHDFPKVTLVGVISGDMSLHLPDFRSGERTFQLLAQVAGRSGRGEQPGEVIVQTFQVENASIQAATAHDYAYFYKTEIGSRETGNYPPYCRLALLLIRHKKEELAAASASVLAECIERSLRGTGVSMLGPAPAPLLRIREEYRYQILLKGLTQQKIALLLTAALKEWRKRSEKGVRMDIEIDPQQFV